MPEVLGGEYARRSSLGARPGHAAQPTMGCCISVLRYCASCFSRFFVFCFCFWIVPVLNLCRRRCRMASAWLLGLACIGTSCVHLFYPEALHDAIPPYMPFQVSALLETCLIFFLVV